MPATGLPATGQPANGQPAIDFRGVIALIDGFPALAGVDLQVSTGEIVWLRGRNGSGKTTLLRACAGLNRLAGDRAVVLGNDLLADGAAGAQARQSVRSNVGLLGHIDALYADLTVADQLAYNAKLVRADVSEIDAVLERVGLETRLRAVPIRRLSAGQRRRLALAILALVRPRLWLLDEPHAGLDESGRAMVDELIHEASAAGATVVLVAHEPARLASQASRASQTEQAKPSKPAEQASRVRQAVMAGGQVHEQALLGSSDG